MTEPQSPAQQPSRRSWIPLLSHGACHQLKLRQHLQSCLAARQTLLSLPAFSRFFLSSPGTQSVLSHLPYSLTSVAEPRGLPCIPATLSKCHGGGQMKWYSCPASHGAGDTSCKPSMFEFTSLSCTHCPYSLRYRRPWPFGHHSAPRRRALLGRLWSGAGAGVSSWLAGAYFGHIRIGTDIWLVWSHTAGTEITGTAPCLRMYPGPSIRTRTAFPVLCASILLLQIQ